MQGGGPGAEFTAWIFAKIVYDNLPQVNFGELKRAPTDCGFGGVVYLVNEHTHPLIARAVGINRSASLARCLDFDPVFACLNTAIGGTCLSLTGQDAH